MKCEFNISGTKTVLSVLKLDLMCSHFHTRSFAFGLYENCSSVDFKLLHDFSLLSFLWGAAKDKLLKHFLLFTE